MTELTIWRRGCSKGTEVRGSQCWSILAPQTSEKTFTLHVSFLSPAWHFLPFPLLWAVPSRLPQFLFLILSFPQLPLDTYFTPLFQPCSITSVPLFFKWWLDRQISHTQPWPPVVCTKCLWALIGAQWAGTALVFADLPGREISLHMRTPHIHLNRFK